MTIPEKYSVDEIASAFISMKEKISPKQFAELRILYESPAGFPFVIDKKMRHNGRQLVLLEL